MNLRIPARNLAGAVRRLARRPAAWLTAAGCVAVAGFIGCLTKEIPRETAVAPPLVGAVPIDRDIRVRLCGLSGTPTLTLRVTTPFIVQDRLTREILEDRSSGLPEQVVAAVTGLPRGIRIGERTYNASQIRIVPTYDAGLVVNGRAYRGSLDIRRAGNLLVVTNIVNVESYLRGVLAAELLTSFHPEAFAAQAVAARTYVLYQKQTYGIARDYDVLPDERSQMYLGVAGEKPVAVRAVERTRGEVCTLPKDGALFCTYYSSCCGGMSQAVRNVKPADPAVPPLAGGVICNGCGNAPNYHWSELRLTKAELTRRLVARYPSIQRLGVIERIEPLALTPDGRFIKLRLTGSGGGEETLAGEDFRLAIGGRVLKSTCCRIHDDGKGFIFYDGRGFGHGVGLCQYGANSMARAGTSYRDILRHYYPGCVIKAEQ